MSTNFDEVRAGVPGGAFSTGGRFAREVPADTWDWEELNNSFRPRLIAAGVARFGLTHDECEDAAQTVFMKILTVRPRVQDTRAYLRAAFLNQCRNVVESRERRRGRESSLEESGPIEAPDAAARIRRVSSVHGAFKQVGGKCQQVIKSYCVEEMTLAETAERSGYSSKTVWKRVQECLKRMRLCLES